MEVENAYYLRCRKDAQCKCRMCEESIDATRDLRSASQRLFQPVPSQPSEAVSVSGLEQGPSKVKVRAGNAVRKERKVTLEEEEVQSSMIGGRIEPKRGSKLKETRQGLKKPSKRSSAVWNRLQKLSPVGLLVLVVVLELSWPWATMAALVQQLSADFVMHLGEQSRVRADVADRLKVVERQLSLAVPEEIVVNCTGGESNWELIDSGSLVYSTCELFSSAAERVAIWGYPLQTAGLLGRSIVDRSFYVLSGRVLEWQEGRLEYVIHGEGDRWMHPRWAASAVHLDPNTWLLEYRPFAFSGRFDALLHLLQFPSSALATLKRRNSVSTRLATG